MNNAFTAKLAYLVVLCSILVLLHRALDLLQPGLDGLESVGEILGHAGGNLSLRSRKRLHVLLALLEGGLEAVLCSPPLLLCPERKPWGEEV